MKKIKNGTLFVSLLLVFVILFNGCQQENEPAPSNNSLDHNTSNNTALNNKDYYIITITVNPQIELYVSSDSNEVLYVNYVNEDAKTMFNDTNINLLGKNYEQAIEEFVKACADSNYLTNSNNTVNIVASTEHNETVKLPKDYNENISSASQVINDYVDFEVNMSTPCEYCNNTGKCSLCSGEKSIICEECHGNAKWKCSECSGTGKVTCSTCGGKTTVTSSNVCDQCKGVGHWKCKDCSGKGKIKCNTCKGTGGVICTVCNNTGKHACDKCGGNGCSWCKNTGVMECKACHGHSVTDKCGDCGGTGEQYCNTCIGTGTCHCNGCNGSGKITDTHTCGDCEGNGWQRCNPCLGTGTCSCPSCRGVGSMVCPRCDGDGVCPSCHGASGEAGNK